eukprot:scaffold1.g5605.t1
MASWFRRTPPAGAEAPSPAPIGTAQFGSGAVAPAQVIYTDDTGMGEALAGLCSESQERCLAAACARPSPATAAAARVHPPGFQGTPLELIRYDQDTGKFELGAQALAALKKARGPVGVVAVCGRARQLLGKSGGFQVAPTHRPCTKGLWMWSSPVDRTLPDGSKYSLVLLDTEGIDAYDQTGQYSTQIFSLAVLLSSLFVFNQMGGIDEAALDRLSLVTEMTRHIRVRASGGGAADESELASFTPAFLWLLRDFYLRLEEDGRAVSPRDYLETALQALPGAGRAVESKNQIRESIKSLFPDRDCFTLMRPEFREGLARLTSLIFAKAQPKRLGAQILSGPMLAGLVEAYVTAINNGAVPTIATAWQGVAEAESRRAADAAEAAYAETFRGDVAADEAALEAEHQHALVAAQKAFDELAIGEPAVRAANERRWREACAARFAAVRDAKLAQAAAAVERLLGEAGVAVAAAARAEGASVESLQQEVARIEAAYRASPAAAGPTKWPRFAEFMRDVYGGALRDLTARQAERQAAAAAAAEGRAELARAQAAQAEARVSAAEGEAGGLRTRLADAEGRLAEAERRLGSAQAELAQERAAAAAAASRLAALEGEAAQLRSAKEAERTSLSQAADAQLRAAEARHQAAVAQLAGQQAEAARAASEARTAAAAAAAEVDALRAQLAASTSDARGWADRFARLEAEKQGLERGVEELAAQRAELQRAKEAAERQLSGIQARETELQAQLRAKEEEAQAAAARAAALAASPGPRAPPPPPPAAEPMEGEDAGPAPEEAAAPDVRKMTMAQMKTWLTENGHEAAVWELGQKRAKKADYEAAMRQALGPNN